MEKKKFYEVLKLNNEIYEGKFNYHTYRYGYVVDKEERGEFIDWLKNLPKEEYDSDDINNFIGRALYKFNKEFKISDFDMIVYPDISHNKLMKKIVKSINNYVENGKVIYNYEMLKDIPKKVCFDWDIFLSEHPQMTEEEIKQTQGIVHKAMSTVHSSVYFSIAKSEIPFSKRLYVRKYLKIDDEKGNELLESLNECNRILIVDDINTTGSTLHELLRNIYKINNECEIYIFTLIGK